MFDNSVSFRFLYFPPTIIPPTFVTKRRKKLAVLVLIVDRADEDFAQAPANFPVCKRRRLFVSPYEN
jgi:hypothetical protein